MCMCVCVCVCALCFVHVCLCFVMGCVLQFGEIVQKGYVIIIVVICERIDQLLLIFQTDYAATVMTSITQICQALKETKPVLLLLSWLALLEFAKC